MESWRVNGRMGRDGKRKRRRVKRWRGKSWRPKWWRGKRKMGKRVGAVYRRRGTVGIGRDRDREGRGGMVKNWSRVLVGVGGFRVDRWRGEELEG